MSLFRHDSSQSIRPPAVAGMFYPGDPVELNSTIKELLAEANNGHAEIPKAIIAPHAGYIYSGPVAASAYARIAAAKGTIKRVVLLGPSHRVAFYGCAASSAEYFATPLGNIKLDKETIHTLVERNLVKMLDQAHAEEHSLEVHLPFLQVVLDDFTLVPIVVGEASTTEVSRLLKQLWGGSETLIVISSDLSHFHEYNTARKIDLATCKKIEALDYATLDGQQACGYMPVRGLLHLAEQEHLNIETLDYRNSGDTAGSREQVVGYGAYVVN